MCKRKMMDLESRNHRIVEKYIMSTKLHKMYLERELNKSGVYRSQHQILMSLARCPKASQKELAECQHVSTATIAVSLKKLEKGGYISRAVDQEDNRFNQIRITPKGQEIVEMSEQVFQKSEEALFRGFQPEELDALERFLDRMRLNLECLLQEEERDCGVFVPEAEESQEKRREKQDGKI